MNKKISLYCLLSMLCLPWAAYAEKAYVTDQFQISLRTAPGPEGTFVKALPTGSVLEIIEQNGKQLHVRDATGAQGWISADAVIKDPPARAQVDALRAQLARLNEEWEKSQAALAQETAKNAELAKQVSQLAAPSDKPAEQPLGEPAGSAPGSGINFAWLAFSFAMLIIGFCAGYLWLREINRRRLGGMHLRI